MMKKALLIVMVIAICLSLMACSFLPGNEETVKETTEGNTVVEDVSKGEEAPDTTTDINEGIEKAQDTIDNVELYSDDTKYVVTLEDNTKGIYYHDGNKITGYEVRVKYESHELAELAKAEFEKDRDEEDNIQSVKVVGNELIAVYGPEEYENTTLEEVKQSFELLKAIQGLSSSNEAE